MLISIDLAVGRRPESDITQRAAALAAPGGAEQPPLALTQVLRISNLPSVVSAIARTEVNRSTRTRMPISATRAPAATSKVAATGDGLLSMITRICLMCPTRGIAEVQRQWCRRRIGVLAGASRLMYFSSSRPMLRPG